jgi:hypothetical protein
MVDCSESPDCRLSSFMSRYRLALVRGGLSHHDSHRSGLPRAEKKIKQPTGTAFNAFCNVFFQIRYHGRTLFLHHIVIGRRLMDLMSTHRAL